MILKQASVDKLTAIHEAQLLTYMKLADVKTGLRINFNVTKLKDETKRFVLCSSRLRALRVLRGFTFLLADRCRGRENGSDVKMGQEPN